MSDDDEWFSPPTVKVAPALPPPSVDREHRTIPTPLVGDMAVAFSQGEAKGREDGAKAGVSLALRALALVLARSYGPDDPTIPDVLARVGNTVNELQLLDQQLQGKR